MAGKKLSVFDAFFLAAETREAMMHVGGLLIFTPPADAHPQLLRHLANELRAEVAIYPPWNQRLWTPELLKNPLQAWIEDKDVDLEYHVRRSALPAPGDERELGILVSRLHSVPIDFHRPPWEVHFIEGLEGGRFAMYFKIHHALVDGFTSMKLLARSLSVDPDDRDTPMFFARPGRTRAPTGGAPEPAPTFERLWGAVREQLGATREAGRAIMNVVRSRQAGDRGLVAPMAAPRTLLNRRISRNRRFATQQYDLERLRRRGQGQRRHDQRRRRWRSAVERCAATCSEHGRAAGDKPLIAMLPVNTRPKDDPGGGNAVGAILCSLATDIDLPVARLDAIMTARPVGPRINSSGCPRSAIIAVQRRCSWRPLATAADADRGHDWSAHAMPSNVVVSNVPGPRAASSISAARASTPCIRVSIPYHGHGV
jgi:diacylglycerol O-acyltransferase